MNIRYIKLLSNDFSDTLSRTPGALAAARISSTLIDVDGDGYLDQSQWVSANQAMLVIDDNGDERTSTVRNCAALRCTRD